MKRRRRDCDSRGKEKKRIRKQKPSQSESKLYVYFANVTQFHSKANHKRAFLANRPEHVVGVVETHLDKASSARECKELTQAGWTVSYSPATVKDASEGCQGAYEAPSVSPGDKCGTQHGESQNYR